VSNIYEALEQAQRERKSLEPTSSSDKLIHEEPNPKNGALEMEEEMIHLYQSINSLLPDSKRKVIQFIASREKEGTSTIARELARVSVTKFGKTVLLWDADLHKPGQCLLYNVEPVNNSQEPKQNGEPNDDELPEVEKTDSSLNPNFTNSNSIVKYFDSPGIDDFMANLRQRFDYVFIDSPPVTQSSLGLLISAKVDGVVLVLEAEKTRWPVVDSVKDKIIKSGGNLLGIVLNKKKHYIPNSIYKRL